MGLLLSDTESSNLLLTKKKKKQKQNLHKPNSDPLSYSILSLFLRDIFRFYVCSW